MIFYEYLPALLGEELGEYIGYKEQVHPGIAHVFQAAAFRFGHTMIPPGLYRRDAQCRFKDTPMGHKGIRLCSTWWDSTVSFGGKGIARGDAGKVSCPPPTDSKQVAKLKATKFMIHLINHSRTFPFPLIFFHFFLQTYL